MKRPLLLASTALLVFACSKKEEPINTTPSDAQYDWAPGSIFKQGEGIGQWKETNAKLVTTSLLSGVDTVQPSTIYTLGAYALLPDGQVATFDWGISGQPTGRFNVDATKNSLVGTKWAWSSVARLDRLPAGKYDLMCNVSVPKAGLLQTLTTKLEVEQKDIVNDFLRFDFGMKRADFISKITDSYKTLGGAPQGPTQVTADVLKMQGPIPGFHVTTGGSTYYEFKDGNLSKIYITQIGGQDSDVRRGFRQLGAPGQIDISSDPTYPVYYILKQPVTWSNALLKFTLSQTTVPFLADGKTYMVLAVEKK